MGIRGGRRKSFNKILLPKVLVASRRNISTLDLRWTIRWVMDVYLRRKSFSEDVDESSPSGWNMREIHG